METSFSSLASTGLLKKKKKKKKVESIETCLERYNNKYIVNTIVDKNKHHRKQKDMEDSYHFNLTPFRSSLHLQTQKDQVKKTKS